MWQPAYNYPDIPAFELFAPEFKAELLPFEDC